MRHGIWGACLISAPVGKEIGGGKLQMLKMKRGRGRRKTTTDPSRGKKIPFTRWQQPVEEAVGKEASRIRCPL